MINRLAIAQSGVRGNRLARATAGLRGAIAEALRRIKLLTAIVVSMMRSDITISAPGDRSVAVVTTRKDLHVVARPN